MKRLLFLFLSFLTLHLHAADYYWVDGGGNWSDLNHWRLDSITGPIPSIVPSSADNVFFTSGSGFGTTAASRTVTLNSNGFCNNMTWSNVPNSPIFNTANASFTVEVWGNMILSPTTTYTCLFKFKGATPATITTNGTVQGAFGFEIDKPGSSLTVTDSLIVPSAVNVPTSSIILTAGTFDISGKKVSHLRFNSVNSNTRVLNMANANVTFTYRYDFTGINKTVLATGSTLNALGYLFIDSTVYNKVTNNAQDAGNFSVYGCSFSTLTFLNPSLGSEARIHNGNIADTIRFMGSGSIGSVNNVNVIIATGSLSIGNNNTVNRVVCNSGTMGGDNDITYWQNGGQFTVSVADTNTVDSLLLTPGKIITFRGTFNVNNYLQLNGTNCDAFSEVSGDSLSGSLNFAPGATAVMNNMILTGLKAFGSITPLAVTGIDNGGNQGFTITEPTSGATTLYWVNGAGDWNDRNHWSTTSGGAGGACVPYIGDNVVFDANSGLASGTITTSSSSFCKNMTWTGVGNVTFNEAGTAPFKMYGSLVMDNSVTMNSILELWGTTADTITTNGSTAGNLQFIIQKTGSGSITLADNWSNPTGGSFIHRSGSLNLSGRTVSLAYYSSVINSVRSLDITNATLNLTDYDYRGTGKTIASTGSHITTTRGVAVDGLTYPWVDANYAGTGSYFDINNTTIGRLTFNATSTTVNADIEQGNTIRRLEFKGKGIITGGGNTIDSLILAGSRNYFFGGTNTITQYLKAQSAPCSGLGEIRNYAPAGATGTLNFSTGAVVDMANVYLQNIIATGPITPIAFSGADAGGNSGWTINVAPGSPRYWIGGAGDWNDAAHWSDTSGGAGGACIPTVYDDVYFDANSGFTNVSKTVTINNGNAYCHNINWTGAANSPIWNKSASWNMEVWGDSVILNPSATFNVAVLTLKGPGATYMSGGAPLGNFHVRIEKPGGSLTLLNNYSNAQTQFQFIDGAFNAPGKTLNVDNISNYGGANAFSVDISNATITTNGWGFHGPVAAHNLNAVNSTITASLFIATGLTYNKVNVSGLASNSAQLSSTTIDSLIFTNTNTAAAVGINGASNTLNYVEYKGSGAIYGTGNTINTLVFFPGKIYTFTAGTTTNITNEWYASGTPCNLTEIRSSSTTANATINKTNGAPEFDYVRVRRITAAGSTPFVAFNHTIDQGNNINWNIAPYDGAAPIYGLGPDTALLASAFPYTLHTDGFFGDPSSQYLWNNGSTADSLVIVDTGIYYVTVGFVDNCNISDTIHITLNVPLPVTLSKFSAAIQNCQSHLNWNITNATNFSHFVIEKSKDGHSFSSIGSVAYTTGVHEYAYTDRASEKGTTYYRLKMVDHDGKYQYSHVETTHSDCETQLVKVYPTLTKGVVYIDLPSGYEQAQIEVYNVLGQPLQLPHAGKVKRSGMHSIQLHGLSQGEYLLKVTNDNEVQTFKVIYQP